MATKQIHIINKLGLHARAASVFVKAASAFSSDITVSNSVKEANGKSIMAMMMLQATCGSEINITTEGRDEDEALTALIDLINDRFGEAE